MADQPRRQIYFTFSKKEIPLELHDNWRKARWIHNRRFIRISSILVFLIAVAMAVRRIYFLDEGDGSKLDYLFLLVLFTMAGASVLALAASLIFTRNGYKRFFEYTQYLFVSIFLVLFGFLGYLDMQVAPDFSAILGIIIILSVTFWFDIFSYLVFLGLIGFVAYLNFRLGVHPSIAGSELSMQVGMFCLAGSTMFYAVSEMRTRSFVTGIQLESSYKELRELSLRDPLTRLFNRRMMNEELDRETAFSNRTGQALTIMLIDVDHFKRVNDSLGHSVGDEVLQQCADRLMKIVRESDRVYRFGGEEFILLLPNTSLPSTKALAERLLTGFSDVPFDGVPWPVTISLGIADNTERLLPADLIKLADSRMYAAKKAGRNRYVWDGFTAAMNDEPAIP